MISQLIEKIKRTDAPICVGLDPMLSYTPEYVAKKSLDAYGEILEGVADAIQRFSKEIIDHAFDLIPAVKPQIAVYEQFGIEGLTVHKRTVDYCHEKGLIAIDDVKRGDASSTFAAYIAGHLGRVWVGSKSLSGFNVDILTVNLYLGTDGVKPFADVYRNEDKGFLVLVKTSSPSSGEFQNRLADDKPLYGWVAVRVEEWGAGCMDGKYSNTSAVVGATYSEMSEILRRLMPHTYFLVPGYGAQGGTATDLRHCFNQNGFGVVVNSFRGIIAAYKQKKYKNLEPEHLDEASR